MLQHSTAVFKTIKQHRSDTAMVWYITSVYVWILLLYFDIKVIAVSETSNSEAVTQLCNYFSHWSDNCSNVVRINTEDFNEHQSTSTCVIRILWLTTLFTIIWFLLRQGYIVLSVYLTLEKYTQNNSKDNQLIQEHQISNTWCSFQDLTLCVGWVYETYEQ